MSSPPLSSLFPHSRQILYKYRCWVSSWVNLGEVHCATRVWNQRTSDLGCRWSNCSSFRLGDRALRWVGGGKDSLPQTHLVQVTKWLHASLLFLTCAKFVIKSFRRMLESRDQSVPITLVSTACCLSVGFPARGMWPVTCAAGSQSVAGWKSLNWFSASHSTVPEQMVWEVNPTTAFSYL